ncbi:BIG1-domain-containing protein [Lojkania enalia]|uniref:Protein BIG1 n=1 Tax=Lojkania enalia TaxID=147567 RepID=A0A9P4K667_9PLEO|nr:BIG1-domain-containing protein [Didymosphaeria enalia]
MAKSLFGALALASLPSALAFRDTSPFLLFSTANLDLNGHDAEVAKSSQIVEQVKESLKKCPSSTYFVVRQPGVSSADYVSANASPLLGLYMTGDDESRPKRLLEELRNHLKVSDVVTRIAVSEVVDAIDSSSITKYLETQCGANVISADGQEPKEIPDGAPNVVEINLTAPRMVKGEAVLEEQDILLSELLGHYSAYQDFTVIYTTEPRKGRPASQNHQSYEMEDPFGDAFHMELKRDTTFHKRANQTTAQEGALFEKYQYLSPGLFMAFSAVTPLFLILYVGLRAIMNLDVSYFAFSKEMGPTAQKKQ